jgi:guanylate kinase
MAFQTKLCYIESMNTSLIFILTGPSGSGKTTIAEHLQYKYRLCKPRTATTRHQRPEEDANAYHFIDKDSFIKMIDSNEIIEYVDYSGNLYGSCAESFNTPNNLIIVLEHQGARRLQELFPNRTIIIKLDASTDVLSQRIQDRSALNENDLEFRLKEASEYIELKSHHIIDTHHPLDKVKRAAENIINSYLHKGINISRANRWIYNT